MLHMLNNTNHVGCTNSYAKSKQSIAFQTVGLIVFLVSDYSQFGTSHIIDFPFSANNYSRLFSRV
jgi:hypothetical protein